MNHTFREALEKHLAESGLSMREVCTGAGVSYEQMKKVKQRDTASTNVDDAIKIVRFLGITLEELMGGAREIVRVDLLDKISRLTDREQAILEASLNVLLSDARPASLPSDKDDPEEA